MVLEKLHGYAASFTKSVRRTRTNTAAEGGARIHFVLQDIFVKGLESQTDPGDVREDIRTAIQNAVAPKRCSCCGGALREPCQAGDWKMSDPCQKCARLVR